MFPRMHSTNYDNNTAASTWWLRNASFLRLKNIEVGYNFKEKTLKKIGIQALRVYLQGNNLCVWDDIKMWDPELRTTPVYPHSAAYASEHGEMAQYNLSYQANSACKEAIEQTINAHYAENRLDTAAVKDVLEKFGTERVQFILANTNQRKNYDGRISQDNKAWAKTIPMLEDSGASRHCAYLVVDQVNPGLTDLFTRQFRKVAQEQQKSSVLQKLKQEPPARKPAAPKKREPER